MRTRRPIGLATRTLSLALLAGGAALAPAMVGAAGKFTLTSTAFKNNAPLPDKHSFNQMNCTGENVSPALAWTNQGTTLHGPTDIIYGCLTAQHSAVVGANQGQSCKGPAGP